MKLSFLSLTCVALSISASTKPCSPVVNTPAPCDYDQWDQERKVVIRRGAQVNLQCRDFGRSVAGNNKWFYGRERDCWINSRVLGMACEGN